MHFSDADGGGDGGDTGDGGNGGVEEAGGVKRLGGPGANRKRRYTRHPI